MFGLMKKKVQILVKCEKKVNFDLIMNNFLFIQIMPIYRYVNIKKRDVFHYGY